MISLNWDPTRSVLRQFAALGFLVLAAMAATGYHRGGSPTRVALLAAAAVALALAGWLRPTMLRLPYVLLTLAVRPIGVLMSHLILLILFYGIITPLGLVARLFSRDPLALRWDDRVRSYWRDHPPPRGPSSYLRQA